MRWIILLILGLVATTGARAGECISVSDNKLDEIRTEYGMTTVEWSAEARNHCDAAYDGTLTINFLDTDGTVLHEVLEIIILQNNATEQTSKRVTLPADSYKAVDDVQVDVRERERPR